MILAILQARVSSSRLPGKVLKPILGKPMLALQIERIFRAHLLDKLIVATSDHSSDDQIEMLCKFINVECFRGSLDNVLDRYYRCAEKYSPDYVVRLTGDCPLTDSEIIDSTIGFFKTGLFDYAANGGPNECTFPDGLDVEIFSFTALKTAWERASLPSEKEHVTSYINKNPDLFKIGFYNNSSNLSMLRWTVDEPEDFEFVTKVYEALYPENNAFTTQDILELLKIRPELLLINNKFERNEGYKKSLIEDKGFLNKLRVC